MHPRTPDQILVEIAQARHQLERGSDALYEAELAAERAKDVADLAFDVVLMHAEGSIPVKEAIARAASKDERDAAFVARATHNRVKSKIKALETSLMTLQAELKWAREAGA